MSALLQPLWIMVIMGGTANNKGVLVGAALLTTLDRFMRVIQISVLSKLGLGINVIYLRYVIIATTLILILLYKPRGLIPEGPLQTPAWEEVGDHESSSG